VSSIDNWHCCQIKESIFKLSHPRQAGEAEELAPWQIVKAGDSGQRSAAIQRRPGTAHSRRRPRIEAQFEVRKQISVRLSLGKTSRHEHGGPIAQGEDGNEQRTSIDWFDLRLAVLEERHHDVFVCKVINRNTPTPGA
jgi:hypothetical protein